MFTRIQRPSERCKAGATWDNGTARLWSLHKRLAKLAIAQQPWCSYCGTEDDLEADHIILLSKGGLVVFDNYQVLCKTCNASKGAREI
jgi:5-methylcytosine-specific restriction endonuclease McrA